MRYLVTIPGGHHSGQPAAILNLIHFKIGNTDAANVWTTSYQNIIYSSGATYTLTNVIFPIFFLL